MSVHLQHIRKDKCFQVYIGGDADPEGKHDRQFDYGLIDHQRITIDEARGAALDYGQKLGAKFGGLIEERT